MSKKVKQSSIASRIQVFELTMDNPEDQEELNCRLRRAGESAESAAARIGRNGADGSKAESSEKRSNRRNSSQKKD